MPQRANHNRATGMVNPAKYDEIASVGRSFQLIYTKLGAVPPFFSQEAQLHNEFNPLEGRELAEL